MTADKVNACFIKPVRSASTTGVALNYTASTGELTYGTPVSDERLKSNIESADLQTCYDIVKNIGLKRYRFSEDVFVDVDCRDRSRLGWIAQEVETVLPKAICVNEFMCANGAVIEDCLSLDPSQLYTAMYGAIQKLMEKVEILESKVKELSSS